MQVDVGRRCLGAVFALCGLPSDGLPPVSAQSSGILPAGALDVEANTYGTTSRLSGLTSATSNGLSLGQLSLRYQPPTLPGFDIGIAAGGSYTKQQGTGSYTLGSSVLAHYGYKFESNLALALYTSAGYGGGGTQGSPSYSGALLSATPVAGFEFDFPEGESPVSPTPHFAGVDVSPTFSYSGSGQLSQGPILRDLYTAGGYASGAAYVTKPLTLSLEGGLIYASGSAGGTSQPQSGSSLTERVGLIGTFSYVDRPPGEGPQTSSISAGIWFSHEGGSISGSSPGAASPSGNFQTNTLLFGFTFGYRRTPLP